MLPALYDLIVSEPLKYGFGFSPFGWHAAEICAGQCAASRRTSKSDMALCAVRPYDNRRVNERFMELNVRVSNPVISAVLWASVWPQPQAVRQLVIGFRD